jgi:hypothetical protein
MTDKSEQKTGGFPTRAILIGLVLVAAICGIVTWAELVLATIQLGQLQLPPVVVGMTLFLIVMNIFLRRFRLRPHELIIIYSMMLVGALTGSRGLMVRFIPSLVAVNYYATPENHWARLFFPHIKQWMVPFDPKGVEKQPTVLEFYEGLENGHIPWEAWVVPLAAWSLFVLMIFGAFFCIATLLRRQWVENERLTFPLAQLAVELVEPSSQHSFLRSPLAWAGFLIPTVVFTVNGLHMMFPYLPSFTLETDLTAKLPPYRPWIEIQSITIYFSFAAIGFFYLLPADLVFSLWFFFLFNRFQDMIYSMAGMWPDSAPLYPTRVVHSYQVMGAYIVLALYLIRTAWPHLRAAARKAISGVGLDDSRELLPYRTALIGLVVCSLGTVAWCRAAGMSPFIAALEMFTFLFITSLVVSRAVAESGLLMTAISWRPLNIVGLATTLETVGPSNLTALGFTEGVVVRDPRGLLLTAFMDSLRMSDGVGLNRRRMLLPMIAALLGAMVFAGYLQLVLPYKLGAVTMYWFPYRGNSLWAFENHASLMENVQTYDWRAPIFFLVGVVFTVMLVTMRATFAGWPFHPIAYAVAPAWQMHVFWFPCLVAWAYKVILLRYGGMRLFAKMRPLFLGMVVGEFSQAVVWTIVSFFTKLPAPSFPWP